MRTILIGLTALLLPVSLPAQRLVGRAVDATTEKPVQNVEIRLENDGGPVGRVVSDSAGQFLLRVAAAGRYRLITNHIGYAAVRGEVELGAGDQVEVLLRLAVSATALEPLEVVARSRAPDAYLERNGFYDRKAGGFGVFRTREDIEKRKPFVTTDLFTQLSGVKVVYTGSMQGKDIRMTRGEDPNCQPRVIVDNVIVRRGGKMAQAGEPPLDMLVTHPYDIQAIEIYRSPSETPQQYGGNEVTCGVVLIWTHRGTAR